MLKLTYYGHSCFSVTAQGKHLLFDPFITGNQLASAIDVDQVKADYIFLSHAHYDHMDDLLRVARNTGATVLGNWEIADWCGKQGLKNVRPINPGGKFDSDFGSVKCVTAVHSSSFADGSYGGVASGYIINSAEGSFYYSGDTALTLDMTLVPRWGKPDFAVLPIGDELTMGIEDAIEAANYVGVKSVLGVHYDTFELIRIDHTAAVHAFKLAGISLHLVQIGDTVEM